MQYLKLMCAGAAAMTLAVPPAWAQCRPDLDGDGELTLFDFLEFQNLFAAGDLRADFDGSGSLDVFDFLEFQNQFEAGCALAAQLAGVPLADYPHFNYVRAFNAGATVSLAIDPTRFTSIAGVTADIYIVAAKTAAQWETDPFLDDARGAPQSFAFSGGSIQANTVALTGSGAIGAGAGTEIAAGYDLVIDVNRNSQLDGGDIIDGLSDEAGFYMVSDISALGPLTPVMLDTSIAAGVIRLNYPAEIATIGPAPLVTIVHGGGHDYRWYDYLQDHLSSWGFISISVRNDFSGTGRAPVNHTDSFLGEQATVAGGVLNGLIDASRISWIGHSLGGREVVIGIEALVTGVLRPVNFDVNDLALVSAIAANSIDGSSRADPRNVNFHMIWGSSDGDISGAPGSQTTPFRHYDLASGFKHSTYIQGADHNDFNCCGFNNFTGPASTEIGREEAQQIAKAIWLALLKRYNEGSVPALDYLSRPWESFRPLGTRNGTTLTHMYRRPAMDPTSFVIDDYQTNPAPDQSSSGGPVMFTVDNILEDRLYDKDSVYTWTPTDPMNGMTYARPGDPSRGVVFEWPAGGSRFIDFQVLGPGRDMTAFDLLSMRVCQQTRHPLTIAELADLTFTVTLRDSAGTTSSINVGVYGGGVEEPYQRTGAGSGVGWQNEFETIRIRLTDFLTNGSGLDLTDVAAVRLDFGAGFGSAQGRVGFDELELVVE
ncbi:MAG: GC-type dockerin domain-anchored protein [Phycisphaerales bacterium JB039]